MRKKRFKRFMFVLATMLILVQGYSSVTVQASSNEWYGDGNGIQFKRYKIKRRNTILNIKSKELKRVLDDRHSYGAWSPYEKGNYIYVCPFEGESKTFGTRIWAVNMETGKLNKFSDSAISLMRVYGKHLYYVESLITEAGNNYYLVTFRVMRSNRMGKNRKLLKKVIVKGSFPAGIRLTNHKFVYSLIGDIGKKHSIKF